MRKRVLYGLLLVATAIVSCLGILQAQGGPSVEIQAPYAGQTIEGPKVPITVAFRNSDNTPVVRFDISLDGVRFFGGTFRQASVSGTFELTDQCDITRTGAAPGQHTLAVRLTDAQGRVTERTQVIEYQPLSVRPIEKNAPRVRVVEPISGATITKKTDIRVEASDDTALKLVKVFINGDVRAMTNEGTILFTWDPVEGEKLQSGSYTISASAWDIFDNQGDSDPVMVMVDNTWLPIGGNNKKAVLLNTAEKRVPFFGGQTVARLPIGGLDVPMLGTGIVLPTPSADLPRVNASSNADLQLVALIPAKLLPGQHGMLLPEMANTSGQLLPGTALTGPQVVVALPVETLKNNPLVAMPGVDANIPGTGASSRIATTETPVMAAIPSIEKHQPTMAEVTVPALGHGTPAAATSIAPRQNAQEQTRLDGPVVVLKGAEGMTAPVAATAIAGRQDVQTSPTLVANTTIAKSTPNGMAVAQNLNGTSSVPNTAQALQPRTLPEATRSEFAAKPGTASAAAAFANRPLIGENPLIAQTPAIRKSTPAAAATTKTTTAQGSNPLTRLNGAYTVKSGDTLSKIAREHGTTVKALARMNPSVDPVMLTPGAKLNVPRATRVVLDEEELAAAPTPYIASPGYTMVPMRNLVEAKGGVIVWLPKTREVNAWVNNNFMGVTIGKREARINDEVYVMPVAALIQDARTIVPLRFLAKGMNLVLEYDPQNKQAILTSPSAE